MARTPIPVLDPAVEDERVRRIADEVALDPPFVPRLVNPADHGQYLEHVHESTLRTLAVIDMRMARGDYQSAHDLVKKLRAHNDSLFDQRAEAARREVRA
jgi:hypothetical protein